MQHFEVRRDDFWPTTPLVIQNYCVMLFSKISARVIPTHLNRSYSPVCLQNHEPTRPNPTQPADNSEMQHFYITLFHYQYTCLDFHGLSKSDTWPLKSIHSSQRYKWTVLVAATKRAGLNKRNWWNKMCFIEWNFSVLVLSWWLGISIDV